MSNKIRTLSQLPPITYSMVNANSLIEISQRILTVEKAHYISKKMRLADFNEYVYKEVCNKLATDHKLIVQSLSGGPTFNRNVLKNKTDFTNMALGLYDIYLGQDVKISGRKQFETRPDITATLSKDLSELNRDNAVVDVKLLRKHSQFNNLQLAGMEFDFSTYFFNPEVETVSLADTNQIFLQSGNRTKNIRIGSLLQNGTAALSNNYYFGLNEKDIKDNHYNEWIFRIPNNSRQSNNWIAPSSGMFTCFGWLDEKDGSYANNALRWVALEAWNTKKEKWYILQLQPFSPNEFCSYVGFSFPVKAGLKLRIRTGFTVGTNSDKYFSLVGSLTNHIANAFIGGIYTIDASSDLIPTNADGFNYFEDATNDWQRYNPANSTIYNLICDLSSSLSGAFAGPYIDLVNSSSYKRTLKNDITMAVGKYKLNGSNKSYVRLQSRNSLSSMVSQALKNLNESNPCGFGAMEKSKNEFQKLFFYKVTRTGNVHIEFHDDFEGGRTACMAYIAYADNTKDGGITYGLKRLNIQIELLNKSDPEESITLPLKAGNLLAFQCLSAYNEAYETTEIIDEYPLIEDPSKQMFFDPDTPTRSKSNTEATFAWITEMYNLSQSQMDEYDFYSELPDVTPTDPIPTTPTDPVVIPEIPDWTGDISQLYTMIKNLTTTVTNNYNSLNTAITNNYSTLNTKITNNYNTLNASKVGYTSSINQQWMINKKPSGLDGDGNLLEWKDNKRINGPYYYFKVPSDGTYHITVNPENGDGAGSGTWKTSLEKSGKTAVSNWDYGFTRCWLEYKNSSNAYVYKLLAESLELIAGRDPNLNNITLNLKKDTILIFNQFSVESKHILNGKDLPYNMTSMFVGEDGGSGHAGVISNVEYKRTVHSKNVDVTGTDHSGKSVTKKGILDLNYIRPWNAEARKQSGTKDSIMATISRLV